MLSAGKEKKAVQQALTMDDMNCTESSEGFLPVISQIFSLLVSYDTIMAIFKQIARDIVGTAPAHKAVTPSFFTIVVNALNTLV